MAAPRATAPPPAAAGSLRLRPRTRTAHSRKRKECDYHTRQTRFVQDFINHDHSLIIYTHIIYFNTLNKALFLNLELETLILQLKQLELYRCCGGRGKHVRRRRRRRRRGLRVKVRRDGEQGLRQRRRSNGQRGRRRPGRRRRRRRRRRQRSRGSAAGGTWFKSLPGWLVAIQWPLNRPKKRPKVPFEKDTIGCLGTLLGPFYYCSRLRSSFLIQ